jgi:hypothetical protein
MLSDPRNCMLLQSFWTRSAFQSRTGGHVGGVTGAGRAQHSDGPGSSFITRGRQKRSLPLIRGC